MQFPITIGLRRSSFLRAGLLGGGLLATSMALLTSYPVVLRAAALILCCLGVAWSWRRCRLPLTAIRLEQGGEIAVAVGNAGEFVAAELLPGATVHPWLSVIRLRAADGGRHTLVLAVDSLAAEDFRQLRVFLRWRADFSAPGGV